MELVLGLVFGVLLGLLMAKHKPRGKAKEENKGDFCLQEAEPLEEQWQRVVNYEGRAPIREDEDE